VAVALALVGPGSTGSAQWGRAGGGLSWQLAVELAANPQSPIAISGRWPMADGIRWPMADGAAGGGGAVLGARYSVLPAVRGSWQRQPAVAVAGLPGPA
jgi:hypothetical protein